MKVLVTGHAGFIGSALTLRLLERGDEVVGVDNLNDYYDPDLKRARIARHTAFSKYTDIIADITDRTMIEELFTKYQPERVIHLAAQGGIRYSLIKPYAYVDANIVGFVNILEGCRQNGIEHLVFASSSSIYGGNTRLPFTEHDNVDHPLSLYAATKKANELMAHTYSHLYGLPVTGLRFFTVYGPWGRPDMSYFLFTKAIIEDRPINVFNNGEMARDFTYIDDIVEGIVRVLDKPATPCPHFTADDPDPCVSRAPYRVFNIGNSQPVRLMEFIEVLEEKLGKKAQKVYQPMQLGDVVSTYANTDELLSWVGFQPNTSLELGVVKFVEWYRGFEKL